MKQGKQIVFGIVGFGLVVLLGLGIYLGQGFLQATTPKVDQKTVQTKNEKSTTSVELAEKAVSVLEDKQTPEALKIARESVEKLSDTKAKASFLARISIVEAKLKNKEVLSEAERAVKYLEENPDLSNISLAQELVTKVTEPTAKKNLQARIQQVQELMAKNDKQVSEPSQVPSVRVNEEPVVIPTSPSSSSTSYNPIVVQPEPNPSVGVSEQPSPSVTEQHQPDPVPDPIPDTSIGDITSIPDFSQPIGNDISAE